ncbi:MAG: glycosyltransferase [Motiliproteus sp.]
MPIDKPFSPLPQTTEAPLPQVIEVPLLSVIVPVGPAELELPRLLADLLLLPASCEIILVSCPESVDLCQQLSLPSTLRKPDRLRRVEAEQGRAKQLNAGAVAAKGQFVWFVHADSQLTPWVVTTLLRALSTRPRALHCFALHFADDGQGWTAINAGGANLRTRWLKVPFGDQAFCLSKALFQQLGGYDEQADYGEDHLLVWQAHRQGVSLDCHRAVITSSARKYRQHGWALLTLRYQGLWLKQALPQLWALLTGK